MTNQKPVSCGLDFCCAANLNDCLFTANSSRQVMNFISFIKFNRKFENFLL